MSTLSCPQRSRRCTTRSSSRAIVKTATLKPLGWAVRRKAASGPLSDRSSNQETTRRQPRPGPLFDRNVIFLRRNAAADRGVIAVALDSSERAVHYWLDELHSAGEIERVGSATVAPGEYWLTLHLMTFLPTTQILGPPMSTLGNGLPAMDFWRV